MEHHSWKSTLLLSSWQLEEHCGKALDNFDMHDLSSQKSLKLVSNKFHEALPKAQIKQPPGHDSFKRFVSQYLEPPNAIMVTSAIPPPSPMR